MEKRMCQGAGRVSSLPFVTAYLDKTAVKSGGPRTREGIFPFLLHVAVKGGARILFWENFGFRQGGHPVRLNSHRALCSHTHRIHPANLGLAEMQMWPK
jgi:hypothetical protein